MYLWVKSIKYTFQIMKINWEIPRFLKIWFFLVEKKFIVPKDVQWSETDFWVLYFFCAIFSFWDLVAFCIQQWTLEPDSETLTSDTRERGFNPKASGAWEWSARWGIWVTKPPTKTGGLGGYLWRKKNWLVDY